MKKTRHFLQCLLLLGVFLVSGVLWTAECKAEDEPIVIHWDTLKVSKSTVEIDPIVLPVDHYQLQTVDIEVDVTSTYEITSAYCQTSYNRVCGSSQEFFRVEEKGDRATYRCKAPVLIYGKNQIFDISFMDVYGNTVSYWNDHSKLVEEWLGNLEKFFENFPDERHADMSQADFDVVVKGSTPEQDSPVLNVKQCKVSDKNPKYGDKVIISLSISDDSPVIYTHLAYSNPMVDTSSEGVYNPETKLFDFTIDISAAGVTQISEIILQDAYGNESAYGNTHFSKESYNYDCSYMDSEHKLDLSFLNCELVNTSSDKEAPKLDSSSIRVDKKYVGLREDVRISFKIEEESAMNVYTTDVWVAGRLGGGIACSPEYDEETGEYYVTVSASCYGEQAMTGIRLGDIWGNEAYYEDLNSFFYTEAGYVPNERSTHKELSGSTFYAGIYDGDAFAANSTMDADTELHASRLSNEAIKELLLKDSMVSQGLYEIDVTGTLDMSNEDTTIAIEVPTYFKEGQVLTVRHLLASGEIQETESAVTNGRVEIDVQEFSPFMIACKASDIPSPTGNFKVGSAYYKVTSKTSKTVAFVKPSSKTTTSVSIPATISYRGTTYKVTSVASEACKGLTKLSKVTLGKYISSIGSYAFRDCKALKTVSGGSAVTTINKYAFYGCKALGSITLYSKVKTIGTKAFYNCTALKKLYIKTTLLKSSTVGSSAFAKTPASAVVKVPSSKLKTYKKLLISKGINKKASFKKL